jgi:hypothetical protein
MATPKDWQLMVEVDPHLSNCVAQRKVGQAHGWHLSGGLP